jgi:DNA transposition AAA+ family ATPase
MNMNEQVKQQIADALKAYCGRYASQNKAANSLRNVSSATISQIMNEKWELISDEMWRNVGAQIGFSSENWIVVPTTVYNTLYELFSYAQKDSDVHAIIGHAGCGKTGTSEKYIFGNKRAYRVACSEYWNRKTFMIELLEAMGCDPSGYSINEMMREVVRTLKSQEHPLLIMDEADKLSDQVLYFFITLYNQLEDNCGMILLATDYLKKRITRGVALKKKGYNEIYSRIGRRFIELPGNTYEDQANICNANGVTDAIATEKIIDSSESDLRRVKKLTKANIRKRQKAA